MQGIIYLYTRHGEEELTLAHITTIAIKYVLKLQNFIMNTTLASEYVRRQENRFQNGFP